MTGDGTARTAAELLVLALAEQRVEVLFLNPGTDTAPVQEALTRLGGAGVPVPRVVLCAHESVALAAAHGFYAATGRPQVVMVHVDVGTQNLGSMLHNAFRGEAGVVIVAGRTPVTSNGELPGGRDSVVHWHQDVPDQAGIVRSYVKWAGDLTEARTVTAKVARAFQVARSTPAGPVYLTAAREVLMGSADGGAQVEPSRLKPATDSAAEPTTVQSAAMVLAAAERPVIITSRLGRDPDAVAELTRVAELIAAPVVDRRERMNLPTTHPCYVGEQQRGEELLGTADALLVVDSDVPWVPLRAEPPPEATVILMDADPVRATTPGWTFPADICLRATPRAGLRQLHEQLAAAADPHAQRWAARRDSLHAAARRTEQETSRDPDEALSTPALAAALADVLGDDDIVVEEAVTGSEALRRYLRRTRPGTLFQSGGSGLGWGVPAAIGIRLARAGRRVVAVVGDGAFLFGAPAASLMAAVQADAPVLVVVLQNGGYAASSRPVLELFPDGASGHAGRVVGTRFTAMPDLAMLAWSCHAYGEHAYRVGEVADVLRRGLDALAMGRPAVVVAHVTSPWLPAATPTPSHLVHPTHRRQP